VRAVIGDATVKTHHAVPVSSIALIMGSVLCFSVLDSIIKTLAPSYPVPFLVWARWVVQTLALVIWWGPQMKGKLFATHKPRVQILRGAVLVGSSIFFMSALKYLPLAEATALNYSTPVIVTLMAAMFLGERLNRASVGFVLAGVAGMLLIVRPGGEVFHGAALLALGSALCYSVFQILTRTVVGDDPRVSLFLPALVGALLATLALPFVEMPRTVAATDIALLVAGALVGTCGHFMFILAFRHGAVSALTPFTYFQIVFATLIGWALFGAFPDTWALAGMTVIALSGLLITLSQQRRLRTLAAFIRPEPTAVD
jgi:drug/metabolite transporter (DMT)-like permease